MIIETIKEFFLIDIALNKKIAFKTIYADMAGDALAGLLLSQVIYWYRAGKNGKSKLRVYHDGEFWIAKKREDWWDEVRLKPRQVDRALEILRKRGLIVTKLYRFAGAPTVHVRIEWDGFLTIMGTEIEKYKDEIPSYFTDP